MIFARRPFGIFPFELKSPMEIVEVLQLYQEAGFRLKRDEPSLLPYQEFLVFDKP